MSLDQNKPKVQFVLFIIVFVVVVSIFVFKYRVFHEPILTEVGESNLALYIATTESNNVKIPDSLSTSTASTTVITKGDYFNYSNSKLASLPNDTKIILFFNAVWSPKSELIGAEISKADIPSGIIILIADYDKYTDLRKKYFVTAPETFVQTNVSGELIKKLKSKDIEAVFKELE